MNTSPIRILGIAPYEGMKTMMQNIASKREDIALSVFVGDLEKGVEIAKQYDTSNIDVIVSRGGTAEMLNQAVNVPIIEITLTVYDILRAIKLMENFSDKYAIIGFPSITRTAHTLCDLLQYDIDIYTIHSTEEAKGKLMELKANGYHMVICDMVTNTLAKTLGLNSILITSGIESIEDAFDQAIKATTNHRKLINEKNLYSELLMHQKADTILFDPSGAVLYSTLQADQADVLSLIEKELLSTLESGERKVAKNLNGNLIFIEGQTFEANEERYAVFYVTANNIPVTSNKYGIRYHSKSDLLNDPFNSFFSSTQTTSTQATIDAFNKTSSPIVVIGEEGTGKEQVAGLIYTQSRLQNNPFIVIDFALMNDKHWSFLTNHYNTPLNDNGNTIYFKNIEHLDDAKFKQMFSTIMETNLCKRNRVLFSFTSNPQRQLPDKCKRLMNDLSCLSINLEPLRNRREELPSLSSIYISTLNVTLAKQIIGFESDAMALMQAFEWNQNLTQLKRVLQQLVTVTTTPYIKAEEAARVLDYERKQTAAAPASEGAEAASGFDINRTLDEINKDIVQQILEEVNGNQTMAAKRLGISRTTIWRLLKAGQ
ncbi:sigma-54-dependent transcriptional regulator [Anaerotalea alkaliphila]|uniref:Sigma-54-dependent transcriptional regulator n=1 Tax=Anaerotalea alkaliphila TaxID=2662126 RepID=A0A7X5KND8_9FIRM|nr:sigma-54-dependent transcriptional regulator [Anaerotalea alkaliphila]NDL66662.1 sigma-54-dependent transcriptional regulator [Anaerotalea alkaliphila]